MNKRMVGRLAFQLDLSQPLYEQVMDQMRSFIAKGEIGLGEKIPSVREMAQGLKVNPNTVMRAYQQLERDGLTEQRRGQGTFITTDQRRVDVFRSELMESIVDDFMLKMTSLGLTLEEIVKIIHKQHSQEQKVNYRKR